MKKNFLATAICFSICMTACSGESVSTDNLSEPDTVVITVNQEQFQTENDIAVLTGLEITSNETEVNSFGEKGLVPGEFTDTNNDVAVKYIINVPDAELSKVNINNVDVDIQDITLGEMLEATGLTHCVYGSTDLQLADYVFTSDMYGVLADETNLFSFGSLMSIEIIDDDGNLVHGETDIDSNLCAVKGIYTSDFFIQDDFDVVYYNGVKCGMPIEDAYALLGSEGFKQGESIDHTEAHYFCNNRQVLIIKPTRDGIVDDIMLLNI